VLPSGGNDIISPPAPSVSPHALITGGGRGIGAAIARALTHAGADVTILGRDPARLAAMVATGAARRHVVADLTQDGAIAHAAATAEGEAGPIVILVNNAGAAESAPFARHDAALWHRMIAINLTAVYATTHALLPAMVGRGWGRVVNIASTAGLTGYPYVAGYVAAKHGVVGLTRALALETARSRVTVNAVCPGYTETDLLTESLATVMAKTGKSEAEVRKTFTRSNPQGRLVTAEEVAAVVAFLCGPGSDAITGQAIAVAGGEVM
ncbi:MAG TPA: SDR family NAD(P)-dependent oxidoreductase, partial [Acetobacteraceae bacterium]|nr:SDR family NAD(P)-dependent oxidoreductase [Acetobacteraceae bacterium]